MYCDKCEMYWELCKCDPIEEKTEASELVLSDLLCVWRRTGKELPSKKGEYYLFGGWDENHKFVYDKLYYAVDGRINGWAVEVAIRRGNIFWCRPNEPTCIT